MPILEGKAITKNFGGLAALTRVDFAVEKGEILGLIGPNGAGKTTLLNCISGVFPLTSGDIRFHDKSIARLKPHQIAKLGIGRTFQITEPFSSMTTKENVTVAALFGRGGEGKDLADAVRRAEKVLGFLGLGDKANLSTRELTVPDLKRLEFARALALEPELLLLDEVMAGLTPTEVEETMGMIRRVRDTGISIMVIEHVMRAIMGCCDHVVVLFHGEKIADGSPEQVANDDAVIQAYLGERYAKRKRQAEAPGCPSSITV